MDSHMGDHWNYYSLITGERLAWAPHYPLQGCPLVPALMFIDIGQYQLMLLLELHQSQHQGIALVVHLQCHLDLLKGLKVGKVGYILYVTVSLAHQDFTVVKYQVQKIQVICTFLLIMFSSLVFVVCLKFDGHFILCCSSSDRRYVHDTRVFSRVCTL